MLVQLPSAPDITVTQHDPPSNEGVSRSRTLAASCASLPPRRQRGALGDKQPAADIVLTVSHSVDGMLVNGTSIVLEIALGRDTLEFFHVELARHDVVDAENAACESYRTPGAEACAPMPRFFGKRDELRSRLRSAVSPIVDQPRPLNVIRDNTEEHGTAKMSGPRLFPADRQAAPLGR